MDFNRITVVYFHLTKLVNCEYEHGQEFEYDWDIFQSIVKNILVSGYNVKIIQSHSTKTLIVWVDDKNFRQR